jgi:hypothetical protein
MGLNMGRVTLGGVNLAQLRRGLVLACSLFAAAEACLAQTTNVLASADGVVWGPQGTRVVLTPAQQADTLQRQLAALPATTAFYLTFVGLHVESDPGVAYNAYLNLPRGAVVRPGVSDPHFIGTLSLFDAEPPIDRSLNITLPLRRRLAAESKLDVIDIRILPAGFAREETRVTVKSIRLSAR